MWFRREQLVGSCECGNEHFGFHKIGGIAWLAEEMLASQALCSVEVHGHKGWYSPVEMWWNTVTNGRGSEGETGEWSLVASTVHTTSEHGVSTITTADAHASAASSRLNWRPHRFKWTSPFRRKKKSGFCAWAITFQTQSNNRTEQSPFWGHCSLSCSGNSSSLIQ